MSDVLSRERIAEIVLFNEDLDITNFVAHKTIGDLLRERAALLGLLKESEDVINTVIADGIDDWSDRFRNQMHSCHANLKDTLTKTGRLT